MAKETKTESKDFAAGAAITAPPANTDVNVQGYAGENPDARGLLCLASGAATPSNGNAIFYVCARTGAASDAPMSANELLSASVWINPSPENNKTVNWSFPSQNPLTDRLENCPCADNPPSTHDNAHIWVAAFEAPVDQPADYAPMGLISREFGGKAVASCILAATEKSASASASASTAGSCCHSHSGATPHVHEGSGGLIGDWLHYRRLNVNLINGNRLLDECGQPVHASVIAVACKDVRWHPSNRSALTVRDSLPHVQHPSRGGTLKFPELPPYSVVIYQPSKNFAYVVKSMCADHPNILSLDPNVDIYVTVNDRLPDYYDNSGNFSLLLSVVED